MPTGFIWGSKGVGYALALTPHCAGGGVQPV